jgi:hypothetical protein
MNYPNSISEIYFRKGINRISPEELREISEQEIGVEKISMIILKIIFP